MCKSKLKDQWRIGNRRRRGPFQYFNSLLGHAPEECTADDTDDADFSLRRTGGHGLKGGLFFLCGIRARHGGARPGTKAGNARLSCTAILAGKNDTTGVALVEVYNLQ